MQQELGAIGARVPGASWREIAHAPHPVDDPDGVHPLARVRVLEFALNADLQAIDAMLDATPGVREAHPNFIMRTALVPNDPMYNQQYGPQITNSEPGWEMTTGDASVIVCVADTGINFDHEDFQDATIWTNPGEIADNGIDDDNNGFIDDVHGWDGINFDNDPRDRGGHGSHVAGTIGARLNNGIGIAGMANVTLVPFQVFSSGGGGTFEAITQAIFYATDNGFQALNYSGGGSGDVQILEDAVQYAWDNGMLVVAAAGNGNNGQPFYPAWYPGSIAVSGTDSNDNRYTSSNYGNHIDVAAPGVDVFSCWWSGASSYNSITGTSMSTPHVTGLVALMLSLDDSLSNQELRDLLHIGADDLGDPGFDIFFGHGRINVANTLQTQLERTLTLSLPMGIPELVEPQSIRPVGFMIREHNDSVLDRGTERMFVRNIGGDWVPVGMIPFWSGDGVYFYEPVLRNLDCGDDPDLYFSATTTDGQTVLLPEDGPISFFSTDVGTFSEVLADSFDTDQGWTVENAGATTGDWERGIVNDDPNWAWDPEGDSDGDGWAYVTGNSGRDDVDRGSTILISPSFDLTGGGAKISFDYFLNQNRQGQEDGLFVEIDSNDGAGPWIPLAEYRSTTNGWQNDVIRQDALDGAGVTSSSTMRLRFTATDASPEGVVEAGLDAVLIQTISCDAACVADFDGDGDIDAEDFFAFLDAFAAGDDRADIEGDGTWTPRTSLRISTHSPSAAE